MGHVALSTCTHPVVGGRFLPSPADDPAAAVFDTGVDLGFPWSGWCPDGLSERVIDRLYGDLLHDGLDDPSEASCGAALAGLVVFFSLRVPAGQARVAGGEAA